MPDDSATSILVKCLRDLADQIEKRGAHHYFLNIKRPEREVPISIFSPRPNRVYESTGEVKVDLSFWWGEEE